MGRVVGGQIPINKKCVIQNNGVVVEVVVYQPIGLRVRVRVGMVRKQMIVVPHNRAAWSADRTGVHVALQHSIKWERMTVQEVSRATVMPL